MFRIFKNYKYRNEYVSKMLKYYVYLNPKKSYTTLLKLSSKHFKKALKKEKNTINQLNIIYNLKLKGSSKKANKNLEKLKLDKANLSEIENEIVQNIITNSI